MRDGKGTLTSHNGSIFTGRWHQDKKHGPGEMKGSEKQIFVENWKYGVLVSRKLKDEGRKAVNQSSLNRPQLTNSSNPMRVESASSFLEVEEENDASTFNFSAIEDKSKVENEMTRFLGESPEIGEWSVDKVVEWAQTSGLSRMENLIEIFREN